MRHIHADVIHAWAEGAEIQVRCYNGVWKDVVTPSFDDSSEYRIKTKEPEWWEDIPEHGVLVKRIGNPDMCGIVYSHTLTLTPDLYKNWEPLTNDELEMFKR